MSRTGEPVPHQRIATIPRYQPGRSAEESMAEHGLSSAVKLASNESPFGPLPGVVEAVAAATARSGRYPDHLAGMLRDVLADRHRVEAERVTVGCGSVGLLQQLTLAYAGPGDEVLFPWPSFIAYPQFTLLSGASVIEAPLRHWVADVEAVLAAATARTTMVLIANPNNPTSTALRTVDLLHLVDALPPSVLVVVDEAYREYVTDDDVPDALELFRGRPNVAVLRTFSKAWALAGLRVGYLVGDQVVANAADATLTPFSVSGPAQSAALAALAQEEEVRRRAGLVVAERTRVMASLAARARPVPDSQGNFIWLPTGPASGDLATAMEREGVVTRPFPAGIRVTIGLAHENDRFLDALDAALPEVPQAAAAWERFAPPAVRR
ncbi:MAG TPA: histidinol-phosphate transaminase [Acidimicrobiales bacterium]|nr:histidinol-phosphate transaminase [Acidimicrobiales bacterium]